VAGVAPDPLDDLAVMLRPIPVSGPGVCRTCRGPILAGFATCFSCAGHVRVLEAVADAVVPVSLAVKGGGFAQALWRYKYPDAEGRDSRQILRRVLAGFLDRHEPCVAGAAGLAELEQVTVVPSARRTGIHPLAELVATLPRLRSRLCGFRGAGRAGPAGVLLLDDTWTTGWHAQRAAEWLKLAGVGRIVILVLGRHVAAGGELGDRARSDAGFRWDACAVHRAGPGGRGYCW